MSHHQIEITADEQHYILNGICYHITFPIHLALEHPTQKQRICPNAPERPRRPLNLNYSMEHEDYFERFLSQMEANDTNTPYDAILELSDDEEQEEADSLHYVSEVSEDEEEEQEDKENDEPLFSKVEQAIHDGRITFREKLFNTQYLCCNN